MEAIDKVVVSINAEWKSYYENFLIEYSIDQSRVILTTGGNSRFTSLKNITQAAYDDCHDDNAIIVTHDCARLFVSKRIITDNITMIPQFDMVTTSLQTIDTMLYSEDGVHCTAVPDRTKLWNDQGPQTYRVGDFLRYYEMIPEAELPEYIEAGKLFRSQGKRVGIVPGDRLNFKITNDIDLDYAEFLIKMGVVK